MDGSTYVHKEEGKGVPRVFHHGVDLQLDMPFALQLQEMFGSVGYNIDKDDLLEEDLVVSVDLNLAETIHGLYIKDSLRQALAGNDEVDAETQKETASEVMKDEEGKGVPISLHGGIALQLHPAFVIQLQELFHTEDGSSEHDLNIFVDLKCAKQIHSAWCDTFKQNVEILLEDINGDEVFAKQLQEIEDKLFYVEARTAAGLPKLEGKCDCGNDDESRFWEIYFKASLGDEFVGVCCKIKKCQREYFVEKMSEEEDESKDPIELFWRGERLLKKYPLRPDYNEGFQANLARERIKKISSLKEGDHIMWSRWYFIWHHGIVTEVGKDHFKVINWAEDKDEDGGKVMKIKEETFRGEGLDKLFRVNYPHIYSGRNEEGNRALTVARANSRLHKDGDPTLTLKYFAFYKDGEEDNTDYAFFNANCEHFASYCVLGAGFCHQSLWAMMTTCDTVQRNLGKSFGMTATEALLAEGIENLAKAPEVVGCGGLVLVELLSLAMSWWRLRKLYQEGKITRTVFLQELGKRVGGFVGAGGVGAAVGALMWFCPPLEIILTPIAALLGRFTGEQLGFSLALYMTDKMQTDKKIVASKKELKIGDHIVQSKSWFWSGTHGLFVDVESTEGYIVAIMFEKECVSMQEIPLSGVTRIIYLDTDTLADGETVIARAEQFVTDPDFHPMHREQQVRWCKMSTSHHSEINASSEYGTAALVERTSRFVMD